MRYQHDCNGLWTSDSYGTYQKLKCVSEFTQEWRHVNGIDPNKQHVFWTLSVTASLYILYFITETLTYIKPLTPNDDYSGRTAPLTSKCYILYIYSTNIGTEYFKRGIYSPFFPLQNAVCFINLTYLVPVLFTFYIQGVIKLKKIIPAPKG